MSRDQFLRWVVFGSLVAALIGVSAMLMVHVIAENEYRDCDCPRNVPQQTTS